MRKIDGFTFEGEWVQDGLDYIEKEIDRELTKEEEQEIATLWDWNYSNEDCVEMLKMGLTAIEYDGNIMEDF